MVETNSRPAQVNLGKKTQRQIVIVFLLSVIASSVMIFFYVSSKTAEMLEKERLEKQETEESSGVDLPRVDSSQP